MPKFSVNDMAYVPASLLPGGDREIFAMVRRKINSVTNRTIRVDLPGGNVSGPIASSKAHTKLGVALISIGDFASEPGLILPLSKSALQFCRLLLADDHLVYINIRSIDELGIWWKKHHDAYTHIILIGHGDSGAIYFGVDGAQSAANFHAVMNPAAATPKIFISLCCENGQAPFAQDFSTHPFCSSLIAPSQSIHGAAASHYLQTLLSLHLLQGKSSKIAFRHSNTMMPGSDQFLMWKNGVQQK